MMKMRRLFSMLLAIAVAAATLGAGVSGASAPQSSVLFSDDFSERKPEWIINGGTWEFVDGKLFGNGMPTDQEPSAEPKYIWVDGLGSDVVVTADVTPLDTSNSNHRIGLSAHVKGGAGDTKWNLIFQNGRISMLEEGIAWKKDVPFAYENGKTYTFKMSVVGNLMNGKVWMAGEPEPAEWMVTDTFAGQLGEDGIGLYAGDGAASFDNVIVAAAPSFFVKSLVPGNVFTYGETPGVQVELRSKGGGSYVIKADVADGKGNTVYSEQLSANVSEQSPFVQALAIPGLQKGHYTAKFSLLQNGENIQSTQTTLAVVSPASEENSAASPFGIGSRGAFMGDRFDENEVADRYAILKKMGAKWLREELFWDSLRPDPNQPYRWDKFDFTVKQARETELHIMGILDYFSGWSMPYGDGKNTEMDEAISNFAEYVTDAVNRYKPNGTIAQEQGWTDGYGITAWEIWNEPPTFWFGTAEQFGRLVDAASAAIRSADPDATIIVSNGGDDFDQKVFDIAGADSYDELAIHIYPGPLGPEKGNFAEQVVSTRAFLNRNGLANAGIWVTEFGWDTYQVSEWEQAAFLVRANVEMLSAGAEWNFVFTFNYGSEPPGWSVVHTDMTPKPSLAAYAEMAHQLTGASPVKKLELGSAVRGHLYSKGSEHTALVWSIEEAGTLHIDGSGLTAYDMMGNVIGQSAEDGLTVPLTNEPVYVVAVQGTAAELEQSIEGGIITGIAPLGLAVGSLNQLPTDLPNINVAVTNRTNNTQNGAVHLTLPAGWEAESNDLAYGALQPGGTQTVQFALSQVVTNSANIYTVQAGTSAADGTAVRAAKDLNVLASVDGTPVVDGSLDDWGKALPVHMARADQIVGIPNWTAADLSASVYTMWDENNMYFGAEVTDDAHVQQQTGFWIWASDSFQIYFDTLNDKATYPAADDQDLGLAHNPAAGPQVFRWTGGAYQGDVASVQLNAQHNAQGKLIYEAAIPLEELGMSVQEGKLIGFNVLLNDDDGPGREGWAWWTPGIGNSWDPSNWDTWTAIKSLGLAAVKLSPHKGKPVTRTVEVNLENGQLSAAIDNEGLEHIQLNINGKTVNLKAGKDEKEKEKKDALVINMQGETVIDLSSYATTGMNRVEMTVLGSGEGQAKMTFDGK